MLVSNRSLFDVFFCNAQQQVFLRTIQCNTPYEAKMMVWEQFKSEIMARDVTATIENLEVEMRLSGTHNKG